MTEVLTNGDLTRVSNTNEQIAAMLGKKKDDHIEPSDLDIASWCVSFKILRIHR